MDTETLPRTHSPALEAKLKSGVQKPGVQIKESDLSNQIFLPRLEKFRFTPFPISFISLPLILQKSKIPEKLKYPVTPTCAKREKAKRKTIRKKKIEIIHFKNHEQELVCKAMTNKLLKNSPRTVATGCDFFSWTWLSSSLQALHLGYSRKIRIYSCSRIWLLCAELRNIHRASLSPWIKSQLSLNSGQINKRE